MRSLSPDCRASYSVAQMQEMSESISIEDGSQIRLHASNVISVSERMQTAGRNIKEASTKVASWMYSHPLETAILAGGAMLASSSVLLGVSFGAKGAACACGAGLASGLSADNSTFASTVSPAVNVTFSTAFEPTTFEPTSAFTLGATSDFVSTSTPCATPLTVNCQDLNPFSFNVSQGQGFALSESSANTLLLHKASSALAHNAEFVVDPKSFCVNGTFFKQAFAFHCDEDGTDYLVTAKDLQSGATVLHTGACAVKPNRSIKHFSDCKKIESSQQFECKDNAERACQQVQDFKLTLSPLSWKSGSVFITEKGKDGKDEYRLFFTNHDKAKSKNLHVDVTTDCQKMLDVPLEFECSGIEPNARIGFTLRQNLTTSGQSLNFDAGACAFQASSNEEKSCSIKFNARSECGGVLDASPSCDDKMIMLISKPPTSGVYYRHVVAPDGSSHNFGYVNYYDDPFMVVSETEIVSYDGCHVIRRKIKPDYSLKLDVREGTLSEYTEYKTAIGTAPKVYRSVELNQDFITFTNDTAIPKGFERACESINTHNNRPKEIDKYSVPSCS